MLFHLFLWPVCTNCLSHIFEEFEQLATPSLDGLDAAVHAVHCSFAPHPAPILLVSCEICFSIDIIDSSSISLDFYLAKKKTCQEASKSNASKKALSEGISPTAASSLVFATMQSAWNLSGVQENSGRFRIHPQNCASVWHKWNAEIGCRGVRQDSPCLRINGRRTSASR